MCNNQSLDQDLCNNEEVVFNYEIDEENIYNIIKSEHSQQYFERLLKEVFNQIDSLFRIPIDNIDEGRFIQAIENTFQEYLEGFIVIWITIVKNENKIKFADYLLKKFITYM